jgi:hypothetical protein
MYKSLILVFGMSAISVLVQHLPCVQSYCKRMIDHGEMWVKMEIFGDFVCRNGGPKRAKMPGRERH